MLNDATRRGFHAWVASFLLSIFCEGMIFMPCVDMVATGERIRTLRESLGIRISDIQNACGGISAVAVCKWQRGDTMPSIDNLVILASVFNVSLDDIVVTNIV